eukprot:TRINITY_DN8633_c0_g1_i3.p1 TRINITY_DN8633_c0_g1~~TRINITY_DN8633_c0_g1_i3.p1  ORF type:complete len:467 (+),score=117.04 TRINITY_DN8633_c0_g1_i3:101-1402(+)
MGRLAALLAASAWASAGAAEDPVAPLGGHPYFAYLRLPRPTPAVAAALEGGQEDGDAVMYAYSACGDFGWQPRPTGEPAPALYWGLLYDREQLLLRVMLREMRGLVQAVVVAESNVTQAGFPRRLQRPVPAAVPTIPQRRPNPPLGEQYFRQFEGNGNPRIIYQAYTEAPHCQQRSTACHPQQYGPELGRERTMRDVGLLSGWRKAGVKKDDIVAVSDADEVVSARFIYALRRCAWNVPQGRGEADPSCGGRPVVGARSAYFRSYFDCPSWQWTWHPNAIPYRCLVEGSDPAAQPPVTTARWTPSDLRLQYNRLSTQQTYRIVPVVVGWHLRNFFTPKEEQFKYRVYGHPRVETLERIVARRERDCTKDGWGPRGKLAPGFSSPPLWATPDDLPLLAQEFPQRFAPFYRHPCSSARSSGRCPCRRPSSGRPPT